jgi:hypothetical protein
MPSSEAPPLSLPAIGSYRFKQAEHDARLLGLAVMDYSSRPSPKGRLVYDLNNTPFTP